MFMALKSSQVAPVRRRRLRQPLDPAAHLDPAGRRPGADLRHRRSTPCACAPTSTSSRCAASPCRSCRTPIVSANSSKPVGSIADQRQNSILDATGPINKAADYMPVIVAWQNGAPVRISDVATAIDSVENDKVASWLDGTRAIVLAVYRQPDANTVEVVDRVKAMLPAIRAELPSGVDIERAERPLDLDPRRHRGRRVHALPRRRPGRSSRSTSSCAASAPR